jgi:hypothetical protein
MRLRSMCGLALRRHRRTEGWIVRILCSVVAVAIAVTSYSSARAEIIGTPDVGPPERTEWRPVGCRAVPGRNPQLPSRVGWRNLHADSVSSDEISIALTPSFEMGFVAEPGTFNPTGPVFDSAGRSYFSPLQPLEPVVLISIDPHDGARRFAIPATTDAPSGSSAPMVLRDPGRRGREFVYLGLYDRAIAVRTNGTIEWDVPTGLSGAKPMPVFGIQYVPAADAIVALTLDGLIYALSRKSGARLLDAPYSLPGSPAPPAASAAALPPAVEACTQAALQRLIRPTTGVPSAPAGSVLQGAGVEVANAFSVDPRSSRIWVAATAPDAADGVPDGVSQLGALYGLDLVKRRGRREIAQACSHFFAGGSASTPALRQDGSRVYLGDAVGNLIAVDRSCREQWRLDVGAQIVGSVAVSSDNAELYVSTGLSVLQVFDRGSAGELGWTARPNVFRVPPGTPVVQRNVQIASIGANGVGLQVGVAPASNPNLIFRTAIVVLDRGTGQPRGAAEGLDESVAVVSAGPDGAYYIGNSPLRRIFASCVAQSFPRLFPEPVSAPVGGITKYTPKRRDLLVRDAVCAAADRARNVARIRAICPASARADLEQIEELLRQASRTAFQGFLDGTLTLDDLRHAMWIPTAETRSIAGAEPGVRHRSEADAPPRTALSAFADRLERTCQRLDR